MQRLFRAGYQTRGWFCLLTLGVMLVLAACGSNTSTAPTVTTNTTATTTSVPTYPKGYGYDGSTTATSAPASTDPTITTNSSGSFAFSPATLIIPVGTTVTWTNMTAAPHTVTSDDGKTFDSGAANPIRAQGGTFSFKFTKAGTFAYHCQFHTYMTGTIIVK